MLAGLDRRLARLIRKGYYCIAALDHGLSSGETEGLSTLRELSECCSELHHCGFPAVVLNAGVLDNIKLPSHLSIVAQLVGMPMHSLNAIDRVPLAMPHAAITAGADAVSIQLRIDAGYNGTIIERLALISQEAHKLGMPVVLMLNGDKWSSLKHFLGAVRSLSEFGVDLIKVSPGNYIAELQEEVLADLSVPLLYPGGELSADYHKHVKMAAVAGYAGVCVGRNLFQSSTSFQDQIEMLDSAFSKSQVVGPA